MRLLSKLLFISLFSSSMALAVENTIDDMFNVKSVAGKIAVVEGKAKSLKAGDKLYYVRSPFTFTVESVKGNQVNVIVPEGTDLAPGMSLVRNQTDAIKKGMETEAKLKQALQE